MRKRHLRSHLLLQRRFRSAPKAGIIRFDCAVVRLGGVTVMFNHCDAIAASEALERNDLRDTRFELRDPNLKLKTPTYG